MLHPQEWSRCQRICRCGGRVGCLCQPAYDRRACAVSREVHRECILIYPLTIIAKAPAASIATPKGWLNLAAVPAPSDDPIDNATPARVVTVPEDMSMRRIRQLVTSAYSYIRRACGMSRGPPSIPSLPETNPQPLPFHAFLSVSPNTHDYCDGPCSVHSDTSGFVEPRSRPRPIRRARG